MPSLIQPGTLTPESLPGIASMVYSSGSYEQYSDDGLSPITGMGSLLSTLHD